MNMLDMDREQAVMLPEREALAHVNVTKLVFVGAYSTATAVNAVTLLSAATAVSGNFISIGQ
jgi:hypothetical protein